MARRAEKSLSKGSQQAKDDNPEVAIGGCIASGLPTPACGAAGCGTKVLISEIRYRRLFETAQDGILLVDPTSRKIIDANPFMTHMLGYSHAELVGKELFEIGLLADKAASQGMVRKLKASHEVRYEDLPLQSQSGDHKEVEVIGNLYDENGSAIIQYNFRDISERKRAEAHVKVLMAEVNHRAKNLLAVVQAVTQQSARHSDPTTFAKCLSDRIGGLAAGQDLLVRNQWAGVDLADLVEAQLTHFQDLIGSRVLLDGPPVQLTSEAAQGIGMALHELATNAAKYGALSDPSGRVSIAWSTSSAPEPTFSMTWSEEGGPSVAVPERKGFGRTVMGRLVEASVQGVADIRFEASGVSWHLQAPAANALSLTMATAQ